MIRGSGIGDWEDWRVSLLKHKEEKMKVDTACTSCGDDTGKAECGWMGGLGSL